MTRALLGVLLVLGCGSSSDAPDDQPSRKPTTRLLPPRDAAVAPVAPPDADPTAGRQVGVLPPNAHPDYPTPRRAGTEDLFFVEDPVRGPRADPQVAMPDKKKLAWKRHAYCEIDQAAVICGAEAPAAKDLTGVRVGKEGGHVVLVEWQRGKQVDQTVVMSYNRDGAIERMTRLDETGELDWVRTYTPAGKRYNARHLDGSNALEGCGAIDLEIDNDRVKAWTCLQWLGKPMRDINGVITVNIDRDKAGFIITQERIGPAGNRVMGQRDGVHRLDTTRDSRGRPISERYGDLTDRPTGSAAAHGCFGLDTTYARNQVVKSRCIDALGMPSLDEDGVTDVVTGRDAKGCEISTRYLDPDGAPATRDDIHELRYLVEARCLNTDTSCRDTTGALIACGPGEPAAYHFTLDARGYKISTTYTDASGAPGVDDNYNVHEVRRVFDDRGNQTSEACFDATGAAVLCGQTGFHRMDNVYDDNGRTTYETFFDTYGQPSTNLGAVSRRYVYDNYDHLSESQDFDAAGNLMEVQGMAIKRYYDDSHRLFGIVLLKIDGSPANYSSCFTGVQCPSGREWHAVRLLRSATGKVISNAYFDADGRVVETLDCKYQQCWTD